MTTRCQFCGTQTPEFGFSEIRGYDWESADKDALSIAKVLGHKCANVTDCARRVVAQANDPIALREVARDYENLGELATQAREILNQYGLIAQEQARTADLVAREQGYGVTH